MLMFRNAIPTLLHLLIVDEFGVKVWGACSKALFLYYHVLRLFHSMSEKS